MNRPQPMINAPLLAGGTLFVGLVSALVLSTTGPSTGSFNLSAAPAEGALPAAVAALPDTAVAPALV